MAGSYIRKAEDELSCPICMKLFVDPNTPKNLPCGHVYCEVSLKQMVAGNAAKSCPECRKDIIIPRGGVTEFPTNFRLRTLAENHQKLDNTQFSGTVDQPQSTTVSVKPISKPEIHKCPKHDDEEILHYCSTCNVSVCKICLAEVHNDDGHETVEVETVYMQQATQMQATLESSSSQIEQAENLLKNLKEAETSAEKLEDAHKKIDEAVQHRINKLLEESEDLKKQLHHLKDNPNEEKIKEVRQVINVAKRYQQAASTALKYNPKHEYITQHDYLAGDIDKVKLKEQMSKARVVVPSVVKFVPYMISPSLGRVVSLTPGTPREIELIQTLDGFERALNIACSPTGLFAVSDVNGKKVIIYHKLDEKYEVKLRLNLKPNESKPDGVAIHPDGRYLVARCACIEVYSPHGQYLEGIQTGAASSTTMDIVEIRTTSDGRILAGDVERSVITEHDATGNIMRTIKTNISPHFMTLINDSHIAMSDWAAGKVSVMDLETEQETLSIGIPEVEGICYDEQTECLLITRSKQGSEHGNALINTGVIEQYSYTTGKLVACLEQGLYHPLGMSLTGDGNLVLANDEDVKIYKFR